MAVSSSTGKIAIVADTPTQIAGRGMDIETHGRTSAVKFSFIPDATPAVVQIGSEDAVTNDEGFVLFITDEDIAGEEDFELVANEDLWLIATEAGELRFWRS